MPKKNILIVGFPKSGTTWLSRLVAELVQCPLEGDWAYRTVDPLYKDGEDRNSEFKCYKSHHIFDEITEVSEQDIHAIIYIIRDPRDIVISGVHYFRFWFPFLIFLKKKKVPVIDRFLKGFVNKILSKKEKKRQMIKAVLFGDKNINYWFKTSWEVHYTRYLKERALFIKYEDLIDSTELECAKILNYLRIVVTPAHLKKSIEKHAFKNRKQEVLNQNNRVLKKLIRKGSYGYWKKELTQKEISLFKGNLKSSIQFYEF